VDLRDELDDMVQREHAFTESVRAPDTPSGSHPVDFRFRVRKERGALSTFVQQDHTDEHLQLLQAASVGSQELAGRIVLKKRSRSFDSLIQSQEWQITGSTTCDESNDESRLKQSS